MSKFDYKSLSQRFVKDCYGSPSKLRYHRTQWWHWTKGCYHPMSDHNSEAVMKNWLNEEKEDARTSSVRELSAEVKALDHIIIDDEMDMPLYSEIEFYDDHCNYLAFRDQLVDMDVLASGGKHIRRNLTPNWFSPVALDYDYVPGAECPLFLAYLDTVLPDKPSQDVLQEYSGYCLTRDTNMKAMMILFGEAGTGKSTLSNILEALVGKENRSALPLEMFGGEFSMAQCVGKLVNFCGDASKINSLAEGVIKRFTGGDTIPINRKFKDVYNCKMTAKIIVATNEFPRVRDVSDALWDRFIVVPMDQRIEKVDRTYLDSESQNWPFRRELPGIFNWAMEGLKRLKKAGQFSTSQRFCQAKAQVRVENCSFTQFFEERCEACEYSEPVDQVMDQYLIYCKSGNLEPLSKIAVGKVLAKLVPGSRRIKTGSRGQQVYHWAGIKVFVPRSDR